MRFRDLQLEMNWKHCWVLGLLADEIQTSSIDIPTSVSYKCSFGMSGLFRTVCKFFAMFGLQKYTGRILVTRWRRRSNVTSLLQRLSSVFFSLLLHVSVLSRTVVNLRFSVICNGGLSKSEAKGQDRTNVMSSTDSLIRFCINGPLKIFVYYLLKKS